MKKEFLKFGNSLIRISTITHIYINENDCEFSLVAVTPQEDFYIHHLSDEEEALSLLEDIEDSLYE